MVICNISLPFVCYVCYGNVIQSCMYKGMFLIITKTILCEVMVTDKLKIYINYKNYVLLNDTSYMNKTITHVWSLRPNDR